MKKTMSKIMAALLVVAMLCSVMPAGFVLPATAAVSADNMIVNGDFETGDKSGGWSGEATVIADAKKDGNYGVRLTNSSQWDNLMNTIAVAPNVYYTIRFDVRPSGTAWSYAALKVSDGSTNLIDQWYGATGGQWSTVEYTFYSGNASSVKLYFHRGSNFDYVDIDNVSLVGKVDVLQNGTFETGDKTGGWSGEATITADAKKDGSYGARLTNSSEWDNLMNTISVTPNTEYTISFDVRPSGTAWGYAALKVSNGSTNLLDNWYGATGGQWSTVKYTFNSGSASSVKLYFHRGSDFEYVDIDNIKVLTAYVAPTADPSYDGFITNGDFETGDMTGGWSTGKASISNEQAKGNYSLKMTGASQYDGTTLKVNVERNKNYVLTYDIYSVNAANWGVQLYIKSMSNSDMVSGDYVYPPSVPAGKWTTYTVEFNSGENDYVTFQFCIGKANNTKYLDNVTMKEVKDPSFDGYITNGDFETGDAIGGWSTSKASISNEQAKGNYSLKMTGASKYDGTTLKVNVSRNTNYILTFDMYSTSAMSWTPQLFIKSMANSDMISGDPVYPPSIPANAWASYEVSFNSGENDYVTLQFCIGAANNTKYLDNVKLVEIKDPSFDGYITNGDFETGDKTGGWTGKFDVTNGAAKDGNYGASIQSGSEWNAAYLRVDLKANTSYELTFDYKGDTANSWKLVGYVKLAATHSDNDKDYTNIWSENYPQSTPANTWQTATITFNSGSTPALLIQLCLGNNNARYFDNVKLVELVDPSFDGYIYNGDFETGRLNGSWTSTATKTEITADAAKDGDFGAALTSGTGDWDNYQSLNATLTVEKNCNYILTFDHLGTTSDSAIAYVKNADKSADLGAEWPRTIPGQWSTATVRFNSGNNTSVNLQICVGGKGITRYFDNFKLVKVMDATVTGGLGSVSELDNGKLGVAFKFDLDAQVTFEEPYTFTGGAVVPSADMGSKTLVEMGAVLTNKTANADKLTLEDVDGKSIIDIEAEKVIDVTASTVSFAVRVINIPTTAAGVTIYARPYYVYNNGAEDVVVYATATYSESYDSINNRTGYADSTQWELYWSDEFGGNTLDGTKWDTQVTRKENVGKDGSGNPVDNSFYYTNRPENVKVEDGDLVLTMRKENMGDAQYSSGYVTTNNTFAFTYGRLEFRAKLPYGKGVWPALWTMGKIYDSYSNDQGWPICGEIDILELIGDSNTNASSEKNRTATHNLHWGADRSSHLELGSYKLNNYNNHYVMPTAPSADYHIYAIEWSYRNIKFFVDDVQVSEVKWGTNSITGKDQLEWTNNGGTTRRVTSMTAYDDAGNSKTVSISCADLDAAFSNVDNPHWLIINTGPCAGWSDDTVADGGNYPQEMRVDYVRVYKAIEG